GAALTEDLAQRPVKAPQFLLLPEPLAVRRVAHDHARRAVRRPEVGHVLYLEVQQMTNAGGAGVAVGEGDRVAANVAAEDRRVQLLPHASARLVPQRRP